MKYKVALGISYIVLFASIASLTLGKAIIHWALAKFGLYPTLAGLAAYAAIPFASVWSINKINRDWPTLSLPPEAIHSAPEIVCEQELLAIRKQAEIKHAPLSPSDASPFQSRNVGNRQSA